MKKSIILLILAMFLTCSILPVYATETSIFDADIMSSMDNLKKSFNFTKEENIHIDQVDGNSVISMTKGTVGHWMISKEAVTYDQFVYTVEVSGGAGDGTSLSEISIFVGADDRYMNGVQVYLTKRGNEYVSVQAASKHDGEFDKPLQSGDYFADADDAATIFKIELRVINEDLDIYVNDTYMNTFTEMGGFDGHVGVRCSKTNDIKIYSIGLVPVTSTDVETTPPSSTDSLVFPTDDPIVMPSNTPETPVVTDAPESLQPNVDDDHQDDSEQSSVPLIVGIGIGVVALACVGVIVLVMKKKK